MSVSSAFFIFLSKSKFNHFLTAQSNKKYTDVKAILYPKFTCILKISLKNGIRKQKNCNFDILKK